MTTVAGTRLQDAHRAADKLLRQKGRSFYWARHLLSRRHAARATRLYGFCRHLDDMADEQHTCGSARAFLSAADHSIQTGHSEDLVINNGILLIRECGIDPVVVRAMILGITSDLEVVMMEDETELLRYCYRVAGTVGVMMCGALDVADQAALPYAIDLGIAMQLTNICRDIREDAEAGRRYLPATLVGDVLPQDLINPNQPLKEKVCKGIATLLDLADQYYASGEKGLPYLPLKARMGILVASRIYRAIGTEIRQRACDIWADRAVVSGITKACLSSQALITSPLSSTFWKLPLEHRSDLHHALSGMKDFTCGIKAQYAS